jgi:toxin-antitoxin system PIN domain toxin
MLLPDINVWLALTFDSHVHHPSAKTWFDGLTDDVCFFCRMTQQGFLRLSTNQKVFGAHALTLSGAWAKYDILQSDARISFAIEPRSALARVHAGAGFYAECLERSVPRRVRRGGWPPIGHV